MKIFLDTTFLMPFFKIRPDIPDLQARFRPSWKRVDLEFLYSPISLVEMKFILVRAVRKGVSNRILEKQYSLALDTLRDARNPVPVSFIDGRINDFAVQLKKEGHDDYFDTVIASTAVFNSEYFLTQDKDLTLRCNEVISKGLFKNIHLKKIMNWKQFKQSII